MVEGMEVAETQRWNGTDSPERSEKTTKVNAAGAELRLMSRVRA